jgi:pimeloyl-ACP methyl ester carboxylesterase
VLTEDGYILMQFRIPGVLGQKITPKPPVLFQHGILDSAAEWAMNYANVAPAFVAARAGYDVWLGNSRGNIFSNTHISLDKTMELYWNFDWQEMGEYDIPATLDYITQTTGYEKIAYVGFS